LYVFDITKEGHRPFKKEVTIQPSESVTIEAELTPEQSTLKVVCVGGDAEVSIDNAPPVPCPFEGPVTPGRHAIRASAPGWKDFYEVVAVALGDAAHVTAVLEREPEPVKPPDKTPKILIATGAAVGALGLSGVVVGAVLGGKYNKALESGRSAANRINNGESTDVADDTETYNNAGDDMESYRKGIVAGFVVAGVLLPTSAVLLAMGFKKRRSQRTVAISPTPGGLAVDF
jgi:hypothetical protein